MRACVCVCERDKYKNKRESQQRERERKRESERGVIEWKDVGNPLEGEWSKNWEAAN